MEYEKTIGIGSRGHISLDVECDNEIIIESYDNWRANTIMTLTINEAKILRNYLTEAINVATLNKEEE